MKKILLAVSMVILMMILMLGLVRCTSAQEARLSPNLYAKYVSFEQVSKPFYNQYGAPEEVKEFKSDTCHSISWYWWSRDFMVQFANTTYDDVPGWKVDHTYRF